MPHRPRAKIREARLRWGWTALAVGAANWMVITVGAPALPGVTVGGLKVAMAPGGSPLADRVTTLLKAPPTGGTVTLIATEPPSVTVTGAGGAVTVYVVFTVSVKGEDVDPVNPVFPEYTAVMLSAPVGRLLEVKLATPEELTVPVPRRVVPL